MVTTSNCCCIFSLRTGTLIIGWVHAVYAIIGIAANITVKASGEQNSVDATADGSWASIVATCLQLLVAIALLYGVYAHRKEFVYWYVILQVVLIVISIVLVIVLLIYNALNHVAMAISFSIVSWLIQVYLVIVVYSFYKEMDSHA